MKPLDGIRVLDLSRLIPGPFATLVLSDLGAGVDKVEDAGAGDYLRHINPQRAGEGAAFHALNRGKRSAVIDLKRPEGCAAFRRLLGHYDILFEQFRPGVLERLGLSHASLQEQYPELIICALTGYGQQGPLAQRAGHDLNYLARSGLLGLQGPNDGPPQVPAWQLADVSGGMWCVIAILAALRERDRSKRGQVLDIAMSDGVLGFASLSMASAWAGEPGTRGGETLSGGIAPYNTYLSQDGVPMTLASLEPKFWLSFSQAVGISPDISALVPGEHQVALKAEIAEVFRAKTRDQWVQFADEHDCCVEPVLGPSELAADAQLAARDLLFEQATQDGRTVTCFRTPVTPLPAKFEPAPRSGQHTREIFREAGFPASEIDELAALGAVVQAGASA